MEMFDKEKIEKAFKEQEESIAKGLLDAVFESFKEYNRVIIDFSKEEIKRARPCFEKLLDINNIEHYQDYMNNAKVIAVYNR